MTVTIYSLTCTNNECAFRTLSKTKFTQKECPLCGSLVSFQDYRLSDPDRRNLAQARDPHPRLEIVLDNIRSALNVGSILRTADGCGTAKVHCCGITASPDNLKVSKTGLGAEYSTPWQYHRNTLECISGFSRSEHVLICLELTRDAVDLFQFSIPKSAGKTLVLIIGNEVTGVDPEVLRRVNHTVFLPMQGYKNSLNVAVAFGVAAYYLKFHSSDG